MGRQSSLRRLPPEILQEINRLLSDGRCTLDELVAHLRGLGVDGVSRSALGRHRQQFEKVAAKLRQSREITAALVQDLGVNSVEGEQGRLLVESLRSMVNDHIGAMIENGGEFDLKSFRDLARTLKDLSQANRLDQDFESKVRERIQKETVKIVEDSAREVGLSAETVEAIKSRVLGVKDV